MEPAGRGDLQFNMSSINHIDKVSAQDVRGKSVCWSLPESMTLSLNHSYWHFYNMWVAIGTMCSSAVTQPLA